MGGIALTILGAAMLNNSESSDQVLCSIFVAAIGIISAFFGV